MKFNKDYIFEVEGLIPTWMQEYWDEIILNCDRWKYGLRGSPNDIEKFFAVWISRPGEKPFINDISNIGRTFNEMWRREGLNSIIKDAVIEQVHRVHVNGTIPSDSFLSVHQDWEPPNFWTMIYYVGGYDGDTVFYDEPDINKGEIDFIEKYRIPFKQGKIVFFPSCIWHRAELPSTGLRSTLSINYILNDCDINLKIQEERGIKRNNKLPDVPEELRKFENITFGFGSLNRH
jgi:hypothetical protein